MEDGVLFGPAPYCRARRVLLSAHHAHGAGARDQGPGRGRLRPADDRRRHRLRDARDPRPTRRAPSTPRSASSATASCTPTTAPARRARAYSSRASTCAATASSSSTAAATPASRSNEWMGKGRYLLSTDPRAVQTLGLKLGYSDEDLARDLPRPQRRRLPRQPAAALRASRFDRMQYHRTQVVATYHARFADAFSSTPPCTATISRARGGSSTALAPAAP